MKVSLFTDDTLVDNVIIKNFPEAIKLLLLVIITMFSTIAPFIYIFLYIELGWGAIEKKEIF